MAEAISLKRLEQGLAKRFSFGVKGRIRLYRKLASFSDKGLGPDVVFERMYKRALKRGDVERHAFRDVMAGMKAGRSFSEIAAKVGILSSTELSLVFAGEQSGRLTQAFRDAARVAGVLKAIKSAVHAALAVPIVLFISFAALMLWMLDGYILDLLEMADPERIPWWARMYFGSWAWIAEHWIMLAVVLGLLTALIVRSLARWSPDAPLTGPLRATLDRKIPPYLIYRRYQAAVFMVVIGALLRSGQSIDGSVAQIKARSSPWLASYLAKVLMGLRRGLKDGQALDVGLFDQFLMDDIKDYEEAGKIQAALTEPANEVLEDLVESIVAAANWFKIILIFGMSFNAALMYGGLLVSFDTAFQPPAP